MPRDFEGPSHPAFFSTRIPPPGRITLGDGPFRIEAEIALFDKINRRDRRLLRIHNDFAKIASFRKSGRVRFARRFSFGEGSAMIIVRAIWTILTLPFRLIGWLIETLGRITTIAIGFVLMVVGIALSASPLFPLGIPLFLIGLILAVRAMG